MAEVHPKAYPLADSNLTPKLLDLLTQASNAKMLKVKTIHLDGYTHLTKATGFLRKFASNLQDAITNTQLQATLEAKRIARG